MKKIPWALFVILFFSFSTISAYAQIPLQDPGENIISPLPTQVTPTINEIGPSSTPLASPVVVVAPPQNSQQSWFFPFVVPEHVQRLSPSAPSPSFISPIPSDGIVGIHTTSLLSSLFAQDTQGGIYATHHLSSLMTKILLFGASGIFILGIIFIHMDLLLSWVRALSHIPLRKNRYSYLS